MSYKCPVCDYSNKKWPGLRMHLLNKHKDEFPDGLPKKDDVQFVEDVEEEERVTPGKVRVFENEDAAKLARILNLHGVKESTASRIATLYEEMEMYQNPTNLSNLLRQQLRGTEQSAIMPCLMELFPGEQQGQFYQQMGQYGSPYFAGGYGAPQMAGYPPTTNPFAEGRLEKIEKVLEAITSKNTTGDSEEVKALKLQVEESKTQLEAEKERRVEDERKVTQERINQLISQQQQTPALVKDAIKEVIDRLERDRTLVEEAKQKAKQELLEAGYGPKAGQDFESRVLDIVENQAAPALIGEVKEGRKTLTDIAKRFALGGGASEEIAQGPISDEEAARLSEALNIEETMREMASKGQAPDIE